MSSAEAEDRQAAADAGLTEEQQAALTAYHSEANFLLLHRPQLTSMRMPQHLWPRLYHKIYNETFDAGQTFVIAQHDDENEDEQAEEKQDVGYHLVVAAEGGVKAGADVWILEHVFTASDKEAVQHLNAQPAVVDRLWELMDMDKRIQREEAAEERRTRRERDEEQRREDRKESDDAMEERRLKQAEDEKERERERLSQWTNDESVACVMSQTEATKEQAQQALIHSRGDLIDAINAVNTNKTTDSASSSSSSTSSSSSSSAASNSTQSVASTTSATSDSSIDLSSLTESERRAKRVWDALFTYKYVTYSPVFVRSLISQRSLSVTCVLPVCCRYIGCYYTTKARDERRALTAADITPHLYVNEEAGSAVAEAANPNAQLCSFMCVTLNSGLSVLWLTRDLDQGEEVIRPVRPAVRKTHNWTNG